MVVAGCDSLAIRDSRQFVHLRFVTIRPDETNNTRYFFENTMVLEEGVFPASPPLYL